MPVIAIALLATLALVLPGGAAAASPDRGRWRRPLPGAVVGSFSFDPSTPYERGRRRGIDLRGSSGAPVVAACSGVVTHAGAVPRWGAGVTLRCGRLVATHLGLASVTVARGATVRGGTMLGRLGPRAVLRLGARRAGVRNGYVDPAQLLGGTPPWGGAPAGRWAPQRRPSLPAVPAWRVPAPGAVAAEREPRAPWFAWTGLALVAGGGASGVALRLRRRHARRTSEAAVAHR